MILTCAGSTILGGRIVLPRMGAWYADLVLDTTTAPAGAVTIASEDGTLSMSGTVMFGGPYQAHVEIRVDGGGGGIDRRLDARYYNGSAVTAGLVLRDMLRDAGEQLDDSVASGLLNATLGTWTRRAGTLASLLGDFVRFACPIGTRWRVLPNGHVWLGTDAFSTTVTLTEAATMDERPGELRALLATEIPAAALVPGVLYQYDAALAAARVTQVEHSIGPEATRTTLWLADATLGDRVFDPLARTTANVLAQTRLHALFPGVVVAQSADGTTVDVQLDDPAQTLTLGGEAKLPTLTKVPIKCFAPGVTVTVDTGRTVRVLVGFEGGSPARPCVVAFDNSPQPGGLGHPPPVVFSGLTIETSGDSTLKSDATLHLTGSTQVNLNGGTNGVARLNDTVNCGGLSIATAVVGGVTVVVSVTYTDPNGIDHLLVPAPTAVTGKINSASSTVVAG